MCIDLAARLGSLQPAARPVIILQSRGSFLNRSKGRHFILLSIRVHPLLCISEGNILIAFIISPEKQPDSSAASREAQLAARLTLQRSGVYFRLYQRTHSELS